MIVMSDRYMVNPKMVVSLLMEKSDYPSGGYFIRLYALRDGGTYEIARKRFDRECEAELFMDYCCQEIDKANGVYKESKEENDENIC